MIPHKTIDTLDECFSTLSTLGAQLSEPEWKAATDLPGWTVQDNLAHLVGIERMLQGLASTEHRAEPADHVKNPIGQVNEHEVDSRRGMSGAEVLAEWDAIAALRMKTLRAGDDAYFDQPSMTPTGPGTLADFLHIRVLDCWLHEQDMRRAVGRPGHLSGPAAEHTVDRLLRTVPIVVGKRAATPEGEAVALRLTGGVEREVTCMVRDGRASFVDDPTVTPRCTITMDTETFVVLASGRRGPDAVVTRVEGDDELGQRILAAFNMMI